jgi:sporulation protein YlmC with PRC-barrel domain
LGADHYGSAGDHPTASLTAGDPTRKYDRRSAAGCAARGHYRAAAGTTGAEQTVKPEQAETEVLAEDLVGSKVFGPDGKEQVGTVEDLILDDQQKVSGVVVGVGGFLGIGKKEVGLNWEQAKIVESPDTKKKTIMIGMTKADLEAAPDFKTKAEREAEEQAAAQQQQQQQQQQPLTAPPPQP